MTIVVTAETMAVARAANPVSDEIVLCTHSQIKTIQVDAEGQPTMGGHICPDCALFLAALDAEDASPDRFVYLTRNVFFQRRLVAGAPAPLPGETARAPPVML